MTWSLLRAFFPSLPWELNKTSLGPTSPSRDRQRAPYSPSSKYAHDRSGVSSTQFFVEKEMIFQPPWTSSYFELSFFKHTLEGVDMKDGGNDSFCNVQQGLRRGIFLSKLQLPPTELGWSFWPPASVKDSAPGPKSLYEVKVLESRRESSSWIASKLSCLEHAFCPEI